ncbi:MAG TPA: hypothetical protein VNN07_01330 [Candidatus Tectomicrobia bacterium]|nr:hypothetical protein [Candidatus Tectomicrobia bacterium]
MRALVGAATTAPSGDNCQPWRFRWDAAHLDILLDRDRSESFYDVRNLATWISLGAVLENVAIAGRALGVRATPTLFPRAPDADVVARVRLEYADIVPEPLAAAIEARCVNRRPYASTPIPPPVRSGLDAAAKACGDVRLHLVEDTAGKRRAARAAAANDPLLFAHRALHDGLYRWLRWTDAEVSRQRDGMPIGTLELSAIERPGFRLLGSWPVARALATARLTRGLRVRAAAVYRRSAAIGLISTDRVAPEPFVSAGRLLQRAWLVATVAGFGFQPITGMTFLILRRLLGEPGLEARHLTVVASAQQDLLAAFPESAGRYPAVLFRLGSARPPSARSPRRPIDEVLETASRA